jgi:hypothetical protein
MHVFLKSYPNLYCFDLKRYTVNFCRTLIASWEAAFGADAGVQRSKTKELDLDNIRSTTITALRRPHWRACLQSHRQSLSCEWSSGSGANLQHARTEIRNEPTAFDLNSERAERFQRLGWRRVGEGLPQGRCIDAHLFDSVSFLFRFSVR